MLASSADAKTSAGAPWLICVARVEEEAKLNFTDAPGLADSNALPISVNAPVRDAAANTVIVPVAGRLASLLVLALEGPPHAAVAAVASAMTAQNKRRLDMAWDSTHLLR